MAPKRNRSETQGVERPKPKRVKCEKQEINLQEVVVHGVGKPYYGTAAILPNGGWKLNEEGLVLVRSSSSRRRYEAFEEPVALVKTEFPNVKNRSASDTDTLLKYACANPVWVAYSEEPTKTYRAAVLRVEPAGEGWNVTMFHDAEVQTWYAPTKPELFKYGGDKYDAKKHGSHPMKARATLIFGKLSKAKRVLVLDAATLASSRLLVGEDKSRTIVVPNSSGCPDSVEGVTVKEMSLETWLEEEGGKGNKHMDLYLDFTKEWQYVQEMLRRVLERTAYAGQTIGVTMAGRHDTNPKLERRPTEIAQALSQGVWTVTVLCQEGYLNAHSRMMFFVLRVAV